MSRAVLAMSHGQRETGQSGSRERTGAWILYGIILLAYAGFRLVLWSHTMVFEDHDSVGYIQQTEIFSTWNLERIINLEPDMMPGYPFFAGLISLIGFTPEFSARFCSLMASLGVFGLLIAIGKRFASPRAITIALLLMVFHTDLLPFSFSVLTEPLYSAFVYLGFWMLLRKLTAPNGRDGIVLGSIFGISFLTRTEGFLFLGSVPLLQGAYTLLSGNMRNLKGQFAKWLLFFVLGFVLFSGPQIWRVSRLMGHPAINGRQVWALMYNQTDGRSWEHTLCGLDYSPGVVNLHYIQSHPEIIKSQERSFDFSALIKTVKMNVKQLLTRRSTMYFGWAGMLLGLLGFVPLFQRGGWPWVIVIGGFLIMNLVAPLFYSQPIIQRHMAVTGPMFMLLIGMGAVFISGKLPWVSARVVLPMAIVLALLGWNAPMLKGIFRPRTFKQTYSPIAYRPMVALLEHELGPDGPANAKIMARKRYFPYLARAQFVQLPYTDYEGLVRYAHMNGVDYMFLHEANVKGYPFLERLEGAHPDFELKYSAVNERGFGLRLYRVNRGVER